MKIQYYAIEDSQCFEHYKTIEVDKSATRDEILEAICEDIISHIYFTFNALD